MRAGVTRRELFGWALYDFANSTFATTILILYSRYFAQVVAGGQDAVLEIGPWSVALPGATLYSYTVAAAMLVVAACTPVLGAAADYSGQKRRYLGASCAVGVAATALMVLVGPGDILLGAVLLLLGLVGFNSANVFYNAFLPEISTPDDIGRISGLGWGLGYLGGGALLAINLVMLGAPQLLGRSEPFPIQACFLSVAVWWGGFSIPSLLWMRDRPSAAPAIEGVGYVRAGFRRVRGTFRNLRKFTELPKFLAAFLVYNDGIQTVILMASIFGAEVLGMSQVDTLKLFLMIQGTALVGSTTLGFMADRVGNKRTVVVTLTVWSALVVWAYFLGIFGNPLREFWVLGGIAGLVLGGSQAASRAIMGSMTPETHGAEFFAFYGIVGKFAAVFGPLTYGSMVALTGNVRSGILALAVFFFVGLALLSWVDVPLGEAAGERGDDVRVGVMTLSEGPAEADEAAGTSADRDTEAAARGNPPSGGRSLTAGRMTLDFLADLWTAAKRFWLQNAFNECAAISYYALLSIVPFVALVTAAAGFVLGGSEDTVEMAVERIRILVPQFGPQLTAGIREMVQYRASIGAVSLLVTLWTSSWVFSSLQGAMDRIFGGHRLLWGALKPRLVALGATSLLILSFYANTVLSLAADLNVPVAGGIVGRIRELPFTDLLSSLIMDGFILAVILFTLPPRVFSWRVVLLSAVVGSLLWQAAKDFFSMYVSSSAWHSSFRGSAAAALVFMLWIYYLAAVVLYCAELVSALDARRQARNSVAP